VLKTSGGCDANQCSFQFGPVLTRTIIKTDTVWIVECQVPNRRLRPCAPSSLEKDLQVLQHLGVPEALSSIDVGGGVGHSDVPDSSISSRGDP